MSSSRILKSLITVLVISAQIAVPGLLAQNKQPNVAPVSEVVNGNSQFALALYQNINADKASTGQNIFVSPYSISTALAMTYTGSRNDTQKQMASVLHFNLPEDKLQTGFSSLLAQTKATSAKHYKLDVGNALWGQQGYHFEPAFTSAISKYYDGGFNVVDFVDAREASRAKINKWVEGKTANKIKDLVKQDDVNSMTRLVLTNAIYFKGDWASKFKAEKTRNAPFTVGPDKAVNLPMMAQTGHFPFMQNDELKMIEIPYAGDDLSMIAILPQGDIEKFGATLSLAKLQELRKRMYSQQVDLFLPRFKFETRYLLEQSLKAMGMPDAFNENKADFSGMTGKPGLFITHVIHQAMIDVNEEGSEAAAATAVVMGLKSVMSTPATFRADKPFIFMIVHKPTDSILFMGRVSNPPAVVAATAHESNPPAAADEYAVYAVAMNAVVGGPSYVVMETTSIHGKPEDLDNVLDFPIKDADRITADLTNNFKASNLRPSPIAPSFPAGVHVTFISESERSALFSGWMSQETKDRGWKAFYAKYPNAPGITSLSRVGFNKNRDAALVYVGNVRDWEVGQGMYLLLEKKNGEWKVASRTRGWIS